MLIIIPARFRLRFLIIASIFTLQAVFGSDECSVPVIEHASFEVLGHDYLQGQPIPNYSIVKFTCNEGFTLPANHNMAYGYCISGSFNFTSLPKCIQPCLPKIAPEVEMTCEYNDQEQDCTKPVPEGSTVTMKCKPHYVQPYLVSSNVAVCQGGSWDIATIRCESDCGILIPKGSTFILEGISPAKGSFPWHVAVYKKEPEDAIYNYICGGSIISENVVVSAAHCFSDYTNGEVKPAKHYHVAAGKYYSAYDAPQENDVVQKRRVAHLVVPPDYRGLLTSFSSNIAVVVVDKPFVWSHIVKPVCIDWSSAYEDEQLRANNLGQVVGWGSTDPSTSVLSETLKQLRVPYIDRGQCLEVVPQLFIKFVTQDKFCAGYTNGSAVCEGDAGGGLVFQQKLTKESKYFLRGIVSPGPSLPQGGCDNNNYGLYTKLSSHMKFIQSNELQNRGKI